MPEQNNQQQDGNQQVENNNQPGEPLAFETWISGQDETVQTMLEAHTHALKNALVNERESRKQLEKDLRDLAGKAEAGSEAQQKLTQMADQMSEADRKADFYEAAHEAGVSNLKLAYLAATQEQLFDRKGNVDFAAMKASYPELFGGKPKIKGNAGDGILNNQPPAKTMNAFIRSAAGKN